MALLYTLLVAMQISFCLVGAILRQIYMVDAPIFALSSTHKAEESHTSFMIV